MTYTRGHKELILKNKEKKIPANMLGFYVKQFSYL